MTTLQQMFPRASKSFLDVNPPLSPKVENKMSSTGNLGATKGKRGAMNKTESGFAQLLEAEKRRGEILRYEYQGMTLRWGVDEKTGDSMRYTPDFVVFQYVKDSNDYKGVRLIEIKGPHIHYRQQAIARFKGCRAWWPEFQFELWQKQKTGWTQIL